MSLERDITCLMEEEIFKPADKDEVAKRKEDRKKALKNKPIIPVDDDAVRLDSLRWNTTVELENRLRVLRGRYEVSECACDPEVLDEHGEDWEYAEIPVEEGYTYRYCLRCGGHIPT